jgi:glutamine synthetase
VDILSDADWVLTVATVALVIITGYYARQTRNLVSVPYRPSLMPSFEHNPQSNHRVALRLKIKNIGVGIATDFEMEYYIEDDYERTTFKPQTMSSKQPLYPIKKYAPQTPHKTKLYFDVKGLPLT